MTVLFPRARYALRRRLGWALTRFIVPGYVMLVGVVVVVWVVGTYSGRLRENRTWLRAVSVDQASATSIDLFNRAYKAKLIRVIRDERRLDIGVARCENLLHPVEGDPAAREIQANPATRVLLDLICNSPQGEQLVAEIDQWNASFRFVGIRDNRPGSDPCEQRPYLAQGCKPPEWSAARALRGQAAVPAALIDNATPPAREFAMVALNAKPRSSDWAVFQSVADDTAVYNLSGRVRLDNRPLTIDLAATPVTISIDGATARLPANGASTTVGGVQVALTLLCDRRDRRRTENCGKPPQVALPHAYQLTLTRERARTVELTISARALNILPRALVEGADDDDDDRRFTERRTAHIQMSCLRDPGEDGGCDLQWSQGMGVERAAPAAHRVLARDGRTSLLAPTGEITDEAFDQGLSPMVGLGPIDSGSLASALARSPRRTPVTLSLTIEPQMQRVAQSALARDIGSCEADGRTGCEVDETRAAFIILDADQKPGEILAAAMWPPVPRGLNIWDHAALQLGGGARNASSGFAWRAGDADQVPGSTFKVVTSIAAADRVIAGDSEIGKIVLGSVSSSELYRMLGLRPNEKYSKEEPNPRCETSGQRQPGDTDTLPVPLADGRNFRCLHNYQNSPFVSSHHCPGSNRFGVCEALMVSSNLYFAGLELRLDQSKVAAEQSDGRWVDRKSPSGELDLARAMKRIFPIDEPLDLLTGTKRQASPAKPATDDAPIAAPASLLAEPVIIAAARPAKPGDPRQLQVAQAGFGQAVTASPVSMASVFASVATQRIVRPHLLRRPDATVPRDPEEGTPLFATGNEATRRQMIGEIRNGLSAVVKVGTARGAFANSKLRDVLFGKSGTATVGSGANLRYSLWFSGFTERRLGNLPRIAFVCMVTNQGGGDEETGAQVCAPIVRKVIEELERKPQ